MSPVQQLETVRLGRTGRATRTGQALTLITDEDWGFVKARENVLRAPVERRRLESAVGDVRALVYFRLSY